MYALCDFACHSRIKLNGYDFLGLFEDLDGDVASTRTDFEDYLDYFSGVVCPNPLETDITLLEICLIHNCLSYSWILEDVLADVRLHLKDMVGGRAFAPVVVRAAVSSAIALFSGSFGHDAFRVTISSNVHLEESNGPGHKFQLHRVSDRKMSKVRARAYR